MEDTLVKPRRKRARRDQLNMKLHPALIRAIRRAARRERRFPANLVTEVVGAYLADRHGYQPPAS